MSQPRLSKSIEGKSCHVWITVAKQPSPCLFNFVFFQSNSVEHLTGKSPYDGPAATDNASLRTPPSTLHFTVSSQSSYSESQATSEPGRATPASTWSGESSCHQCQRLPAVSTASSSSKRRVNRFTLRGEKSTHVMIWVVGLMDAWLQSLFVACSLALAQKHFVRTRAKSRSALRARSLLPRLVQFYRRAFSLDAGLCFDLNRLLVSTCRSGLVAYDETKANRIHCSLYITSSANQLPNDSLTTEVF